MSKAMSGYPGNLNPSQQKKLEQLRTNVKDIWQDRFDDEFLCRWLRARVWDVNKAEKMLRDSMEWRRQYGTDQLLEWVPNEAMVKYGPGGFTGFDKGGSPIWIDILGKIDLKAVFLCAKKEDLVKYRLYWLEKLNVCRMENNKKTGLNAGNGIIIFDMDSIGLKHIWKPAIEAFTMLLSVVEANYPEFLKAAYIINAPAIFPICYNICKPFLSEDTKRKIAVLGSNWKSKLLEVIDPDQLPVHWGGSQTGEDGNPYGDVCMGGKIPESYYIKNNFVDMSKFTSISVPRGKSVELEYEVPAGNVLSWQFWTEGSDIGFGLYHKAPGGALKEVNPAQRVNSHMTPEHDSMTCEKGGTYSLKFDNSYSWVTGKQLSYFVEVFEPDLEVYNTAL